ncbi:hypothetical protein K6L44_10085 [Gluconacetobacter entanii]|uniref:hypothetical protein n=1 Tax=Gluconacetobacter entanii TaxID=108528 RepID=UPI001C9325E5|nr:hypothetical protein [Gluconacetobacter entanii]MBY4640329.1 hypothetical protein [Gluconacetobacter entanii]MCW4579897.1 hypothetical protein [Gluconacetobacter entanii]MCW4584610.1 hypothetical protein [Gluconacetobacter entanii]MCW4588128.1 hypothetical protein [Gluconacetobacter entanii]
MDLDVVDFLTEVQALAQGPDSSIVLCHPLPKVIGPASEMEMQPDKSSSHADDHENMARSAHIVDLRHLETIAGCCWHADITDGIKEVKHMINLIVTARNDCHSPITDGLNIKSIP